MIWSGLLQDLLAFQVFIKKLTIILMGFTLYMICILMPADLNVFPNSIYLMFLNYFMLW